MPRDFGWIEALNEIEAELDLVDEQLAIGQPPTRGLSHRPEDLTELGPIPAALLARAEELAVRTRETEIAVADAMGEIRETLNSLARFKPGDVDNVPKFIDTVA